ncbi:MAG: efflux RND transporter periplasmic adaptor subunit [Sulfurimonas sp.]|jgi:HlyD family secretion protein|nr:efflux RND transporter periplasmic adaptor subunit [Sulfurimonas sp.]
MSSMEAQDIRKTLESQKKGSGFKKLIFIITILITIGLVIFILFFKENKQNTSYNTTPAVQKDLVVTVSATGNLEPTNSVNVGIEVSGTILEIYVDYNDVVIKGQKLAKLDTTKLLSQVDSTQAALSVSNANLLESKIGVKDASRELKRVQDLYKATDGNYPSLKEIDSASIAYEKSKANYSALKAQKAQAKALLETNQENLRKAIVVSPIDGMVLSREIEVGQSLVSTMQIPTLFTLAENLKKMEVIVSVDEADVGQVREGQEVSFTVDAYSNKVFKGFIKQVRKNSVEVDNVVTYETVVSVDNSDLLLLPGMTVSADITTKLVENALLIPNAALRFSPPKDSKKSSQISFFGPSPIKKKTDLSINSKRVWVLRDNIALSVPVELGDSDGISSVVLKGDISVNDKIILGIKESVQ